MPAGKALAKRLKEFRLDKLMTQRQLAAALGISHVTLVRIERGDRIADLTRSKIEKFLEAQSRVAPAA